MAMGNQVYPCHFSMCSASSVRMCASKWKSDPRRNFVPLSLSLSPFVRRDFETGNAIPGLIRASTIPSRKILANLVQI